MNLDTNDLRTLNDRLKSPELQALTVVKLARRDHDAGDLEGCMSRLRVDLDKLRDDALDPIVRKYYQW